MYNYTYNNHALHFIYNVLTFLILGFPKENTKYTDKFSRVSHIQQYIKVSHKHNILRIIDLDEITVS